MPDKKSYKFASLAKEKAVQTEKAKSISINIHFPAYPNRRSYENKVLKNVQGEISLRKLLKFAVSLEI